MLCIRSLGLFTTRYKFVPLNNICPVPTNPPKKKKEKHLHALRDLNPFPDHLSCQAMALGSDG